MTIVRLRVCVNCSSEGILTDKKLYKALRKKVLKEEVSRGESTVVSSLIKSLFRYALMRNVIFRPFSPRQPTRCGRDALFSSSYAATREIVRMNRRNDRAIIPRRGTRNFRNKETNGGPTRDETCIRSASTCTECTSSVKVLRENSVALNPSNETFNNFPRRGEKRRAYLRYYIENIQNSTRGES